MPAITGAEFHGTPALLGNDSDLRKYLESPGEETMLERGERRTWGLQATRMKGHKYLS